MQLILKPKQVVYPEGLSISVEGFNGDIGHKIPSQVFVELYEGKLRVHVWKAARTLNPPQKFNLSSASGGLSNCFSFLREVIHA